MQIQHFKDSLPQPIRAILRQIRTTAFFISYDVQATRATVNPHPIFILGNQKSGTSAIAALLGDLTGLSVAVDLSKEVKKPTYHRVCQGQLPFSKFVQTHKLEFSKQIIKEPNLTLLYPHLRQHFPSAQFVFVLRDPRDNIRSILNRLNLPGHRSQLTPADQQTISLAWQLILNTNWLGQGGSSYIERLAIRWNLMADVYLNHPEQMRLIRYEDFRANKIETLMALAQATGLQPCHDIRDRLDVQFQPKGNRTVDWHDFFGDRNLAKIEQLCGSRMKALNYSSSDVATVSEEGAC
ncbi:MAG TPA: sulfotransferase [Elainellaceae cyanobacterium]